MADCNHDFGLKQAEDIVLEECSKCGQLRGDVSISVEEAKALVNEFPPAIISKENRQVLYALFTRLSKAIHQ